MAKTGKKRGGGSTEKANNVIAFERSSERYIRLSNERYVNDDLFGSLVMLRRAEELEPENKELKLHIAETLIEMQCCASAMNSLASLIEYNDEFCPEAVNALGFCYLGMSEFNAARDAFEYFLSNTPETCSEPELASVYDASDYCDYELTEAEANTQRKAVLKDASIVKRDSLLQRAEEFMNERDTKSVIELLEPEFGRYSNDEAFVRVLLTACFCGHEYVKGLELYGSLSDAVAGTINMRCLAALMYHETKKTAECDELCSKLLDAHIDTVDELIHIDIVLLECGHKKDAMKIAAKVYNNCPFECNVIHNYARMAYYNEEFSLAKKLYERILVIDTGNPAAKYYHKLCAEAEGSAKKRTAETETNDESCEQEKDKVFFEREMKITPQLALPAAEMVRRITYIEWLCKNSDIEITKLWQDEQFRDAADWALSDVKIPFFEMFAMLLQAVDTKRLRILLKRTLIDPDSDNHLRGFAMQFLNDLGEPGPHFVYNNGRLIWGTVRKRRSAESIHSSYEKVWFCLCERCGKRDEAFMEEARSLAAIFAAVNSVKQPALPPEQQKAAAGAIEYSVLLKAGKEIDLPSILSKYDLTMRRFKNALEKLENCIAEYRKE